MIPYHFRICSAAPGQPAIELFRASRPFNWKDWRFWTEDMASECWVELRTPNTRCISSRSFAQTARGTTPIKLKITPRP